MRGVDMPSIKQTPLDQIREARAEHVKYCYTVLSLCQRCMVFNLAERALVETDAELVYLRAIEARALGIVGSPDDYVYNAHSKAIAREILGIVPPNRQNHE